MVELSDVVVAQNRTSILLRAFLKIFRIYFVSSILIGLALGTFVYLSAHNFSNCLTQGAFGGCSTSTTPQYLCLGFIVLVGLGALLMTSLVVDSALDSTDVVER